MALTDRVEINIANNAKLRANVQHVLALTCAARPKNTSLVYDLKQKEFKLRRINTPSSLFPFSSPKRVAPRG